MALKRGGRMPPQGEITVVGREPGESGILYVGPSNHRRGMWSMAYGLEEGGMG